MKWLRWALVLVAAVLMQPSAAVSSGGDASACCGFFGNARAWGGGGGAHFSLCVVGSSCTSTDHTEVSVSYFSGEPSCPSGSYDCVVTTGPLACGYDCHGEDGCGSYSTPPSCCSGYKGGGCQNTKYRGCCLANQIMMPTSIESDSTEWTVSYGNKLP